MEGEMNMLLCLYNLLTGSLVSVPGVQVLFLNRYALLLRRGRALYSVCLNDGWKRQRIRFKPNIERRFWVRSGRTASWWDNFLYAYIKLYIKNKHKKKNNISDVRFFFLNFSAGTIFSFTVSLSCLQPSVFLLS